MDDRRRTITEHLNLDGHGLEVAPYFNAVLTKDRYRVSYVDYVDNATIAAKAAKNPGAAGRDVPAVDWVWTPGQPLRTCIPAENVFDYAIATHVLEHVPDTVGWLNQILDVMRPGAVLALALPDRRYTMDFYRRETSLGDVLANWLHAPAMPTAAQVIDFISQSFYDTRVNGRRLDTSRPFSEAPRHNSDLSALRAAVRAMQSGAYYDAHCTVWTPASFVDAMQRVAALRIINARFFDPIERPETDEFVIHAVKLGEPALTRATVLSGEGQVEMVIRRIGDAVGRRMR